MAAKMNTRLVLVVVLAFGTALALLAGVYVLKMRGDATRSYRKGEEAFERGDYRTSYDQFGRALNKDPGNAEYLQRVEESLLKLVPENPVQAREMYEQYLGVLQHAAVHEPANPEAHLRALREWYSLARRSGDARAWEAIIAAADNLIQQVPENDPLQPLGYVYRAAALTRLSATQADADLQSALSDLDKATRLLENNDFAWGTMIATRLAWINKMGASGKSQTSIETERAALAKIVEQARVAAPDGPETARAVLLHCFARRIYADPTLTEAEVREAAAHLASVITEDDDVGLVAEAAMLLDIVPDGPLMAIDMLEKRLTARPEELDLQMTLARMYYRQNALDDAHAAAQRVIAAPQRSVSIMSRIQFDLRRQAAAVVGDVEYMRWSAAAPEQRAERMAALEKARETLAGFVTDAAADRLLLRADAKIDYAKGNFADAAQKFERLVRESEGRDSEILSFASASLQRIGQVGLAHERISQAVANNPNAAGWLVDKASLEYQMGRIEQASETLKKLPDSALTMPRAQQVIAAVRAAGSGEAAPVDDPVQSAIVAANQALMRSETDNARAVLLAALPEHNQSAALLSALAQVELRAGDRAKAREYVDQGLNVEPENQTFRQLDIALKYEDPVQAALEYHKASAADEKARLQGVLASMANLHLQQRSRAEQRRKQGDEAGAKEADDLATRAAAEGDQAAAKLAEIEPASLQVIEYRFSRALQTQDWDAAARVVADARQANVDEAGGRFYQGRLALARGHTDEAIEALEATTDRLSFSSGAWRALAMAYQQDGNFAQAERAYEQAYRCNPNDIEGARAYVAVLRRRGESTRALEILRSLHRLAPHDIALREAWLDLEAEVGAPAFTLHERTRLYEAMPSDQDNAASLAMLLVTLDPSRETILDDQGKPKFTDQRWTAMNSVEQDAARAQASAAWRALSEKIIGELSKSGDTLAVARLRATAAREGGDLTGGEKILRDFIARQDKATLTEDAYIELGRYQAGINHFNDAIDSIKQAIALNGAKQREAEVGLAQLLMQLRKYEEALGALESALAKTDDQNIRLQIVECLINLQRFDEAEKKLAEATSGGGSSVTTLLAASLAEGRANAALLQGDAAAAERLIAQQREMLAKAQTQDPTNPLPRVLLARTMLSEFQRTRKRTLLTDALVTLEQADRARPGNRDVANLRIAVMKAGGDVGSATAELRRMLDREPGNIVARRELIQLLIDSGDIAGALAVVDAAIRQNDTLAVWHEYRGDLVRRRGGDAREAITSFVRAYQLTPNLVLRLKISDALLAVNPPDCQAVATRMIEKPEELESEPAMREMYARALSCLKQHEQAVEQLRLAYAKRKELLSQGVAPPTDIGSWFLALRVVFPSGQMAEAEKIVMEVTDSKPSAYEVSELARAWMTEGPAGLNRAIELQRQAVAAAPESDAIFRARMHFDLAGMLLQANDQRAAADAYDAGLKIDPSNKAALNNLAYMRADMLNDASAAIPLVVRLLEIAPQDGPVLDTVGWVYYKNGELEKARKYLTESAAIFPLADTYLHLAEVLLKMGDAPGAEKQLVEAEKLKPGEETREKIKSLRADIELARRAG